MRAAVGRGECWECPSAVWTGVCQVARWGPGYAAATVELSVE